MEERTTPLASLNTGGVDRLRIKIWDTAASAAVYDNVVDDSTTDTQAISGGSIVIHNN